MESLFLDSFDFDLVEPDVWTSMNDIMSESNDGIQSYAYNTTSTTTTTNNNMVTPITTTSSQLQFGLVKVPVAFNSRLTPTPTPAQWELATERSLTPIPAAPAAMWPMSQMCTQRSPSAISALSLSIDDTDEPYILHEEIMMEVFDSAPPNLPPKAFGAMKSYFLASRQNSVYGGAAAAASNFEALVGAAAKSSASLVYSLDTGASVSMSESTLSHDSSREDLASASTETEEEENRGKGRERERDEDEDEDEEMEMERAKEEEEQENGKDDEWTPLLTRSPPRSRRRVGHSQGSDKKSDSKGGSSKAAACDEEEGQEEEEGDGGKEAARKKGKRSRGKGKKVAKEVANPEVRVIKPRGRPKGAPSRFCHLCWRSSATQRLFPCAKFTSNNCRKVECERCIMLQLQQAILEELAGPNGGDVKLTKPRDFPKINLDDPKYQKILKERECSHCRGACHDKAQCAVYRETNKRRRLNQLTKRPIGKNSSKAKAATSSSSS